MRQLGLTLPPLGRRAKARLMFRPMLFTAMAGGLHSFDDKNSDKIPMSQLSSGRSESVRR